MYFTECFGLVIANSKTISVILSQFFAVFNGRLITDYNACASIIQSLLNMVKICMMFEVVLNHVQRTFNNRNAL